MDQRVRERDDDMICRIPGVLAVMLVTALAHPVWAESQAEIVFWQAIEDSEDARDFEDYLHQFPDGQFVTLAQRRLAQAKIAARGRALLDEYGSEAIFTAARSSDIDVLEWLKAQGVNIRARDNIGWTPMHYAARGNAVDAIMWHKAKGADINARDNNGRTPMHRAARENAVDALEWLRANGGRE